MHTITTGAIAWEAKTAANEIHIRIHEATDAPTDDVALRAALPLRTEKITRREFAKLTNTYDELTAVEACATEWSWEWNEPLPRYAFEDAFGPYQVGRRTEWDVVVRETTDDEMEEARADDDDPWPRDHN